MRSQVVAALLVLGSNAFAEDGWVVLPVEQYQALRQQAAPTAPAPPAPPIEATITRAEYDVRVADDMARGTARLTIDVLGNGWVRVPLPAGLSVSAARIDGNPVTLVRNAAAKDDAPHVALPRASGRSILILDIAARVLSTAGTESLSLPTAGSVVSRASVAVPREGIDVSVEGGLLSENTGSGGESRWVAYGLGTSPITFSWRRKVEDHRAALPLRFRGRVVEHVGFGEESALITADVQIDVVQGVAPSLAVALPDGVAVNRVSGKNVADWEAKRGTLRITFLDAVASSESVVIAGEVRCPRDGRLTVPLLRLPAAERETGGVAVEVLGAGEVKDGAFRGMDEADAADLADGIGGRPWGLVSAFRFRPQEGGAPRALAVTLSRYTPQAVLMAAVEEARYDALVSDEGKTLVQARYAVRNNTQSFLVMQLPATAALWSAAVGGRTVRPGRSAEGAYLLPLQKSKAGEEAPAFLVELVYLDRTAIWTRAGRASLVLPSLDLPVSRTATQLYYPPRHRVSLEPGVFRAQPYRQPFSPAFATVPAAAVAETEPPAASGDGKDHDAVRGLVERLQKVGGGARRLAGILPIHVPFPSYGNAAFLVSELTKEGDAPVIDLRYKRDKKGGWR
jgi:hypothetical protein